MGCCDGKTQNAWTPIQAYQNQGQQGKSVRQEEEKEVKTYGVYREFGYLELVAFIKATSHEEAVRKARSLGYGKEFRIEEEEDE